MPQIINSKNPHSPLSAETTELQNQALSSPLKLNFSLSIETFTLKRYREFFASGNIQTRKRPRTEPSPLLLQCQPFSCYKSKKPLRLPVQILQASPHLVFRAGTWQWEHALKRAPVLRGASPRVLAAFSCEAPQGLCKVRRWQPPHQSSLWVPENSRAETSKSLVDPVHLGTGLIGKITRKIFHYYTLDVDF